MITSENGYKALCTVPGKMIMGYAVGLTWIVILALPSTGSGTLGRK